MATADQRASMNPIAGVLDMLGLPKVDEVIPMPADVAGDLGLPTVASLTEGVLGKAKTKLRSRSF